MMVFVQKDACSAFQGPCKYILPLRRLVEHACTTLYWGQDSLLLTCNCNASLNVSYSKPSNSVQQEE